MQIVNLHEYQSLFGWKKIRKITVNLSSAELAPGVVKG